MPHFSNGVTHPDYLWGKKLKSVYDYKFTMSVKGAAIGHSEARAGQRRTQSGAQLLRGKSIWCWRPKNLRKGNRTKDKATLSCQETKGESVSSRASDETLHVALGCKDKATLETPVTAIYSSSTRQSHLDVDDFDQKYKLKRLKAWRNGFSRCLVCCSKKTAGHDTDESSDFTFFNKLTRNSVDLSVQPKVINCVVTRKEQERVGRREKYQVKTRQIFKIFTRESPRDDSKATPLRPDTSRQDHSVILARGENVGPFWRRRVKKPSPFFQERIEKNSEYIEEETIVLANRHTDDPAEGNSSGPPQRVERDVRRHYPETLTVSVDVSASTFEVREVKSTETDADASETELEEEIKEPYDGGKERPMEALKTLVTLYPPETYGGSETTGDYRSPEESGNVEMYVGLLEGCVASVAAGLTATGNEIQLLPDSEVRVDKFAYRSSDTPSRNMIWKDVGKEQGLDCDKSHPDNEQLFPRDLSSSLEIVSGTCHYCVLAEDNSDPYRCDTQPTEKVLRETACLVVQFVMKAAVDQFKKELLESDLTQLSHNHLRNNLQDEF